MCSAIGVTNRIDQTQLVAFATGRQYVALVQDFGELSTSTTLARNAILSHCGRATGSFTGTGKCVITTTIKHAVKPTIKHKT